MHSGAEATHGNCYRHQLFSCFIISFSNAHTIISGVPVTYVFLSPAHAQSLVSTYSQAVARSVSKKPNCLMSGESVSVNNATAQHLTAVPVSKIMLKEEWLEHVLCGRKWEIRSCRTQKRERVALAQSGT